MLSTCDWERGRDAYIHWHRHATHCTHHLAAACRAQAYGAKNYKMLGIYLQRAVLICCTIFFPIAIAWLQSESLLLAMGQKAEIVAGAAQYLTWLTPCLFISALTECAKRFLLSQQVVRPAVAGVMSAILLAPPFHWFFMFK